MCIRDRTADTVSGTEDFPGLTNITLNATAHGDKLEEPISITWAQDSSKTSNLSTQFINSSFIVNNTDEDISFEHIGWSVTCPDEYWIEDFVSGYMDIPAGKSTAVYPRCYGDRLSEVWGEWESDPSYSQTLDSQRIRSRLNVSSNTSIDLLVEWLNASLPNEKWGTCDYCSGNVYVPGNSFNDTVYRLDTADVIIESIIKIEGY